MITLNITKLVFYYKGTKAFNFVLFFGTVCSSIWVKQRQSIVKQSLEMLLRNRWSNFAIQLYNCTIVVYVLIQSYGT